MAVPSAPMFSSVLPPQLRSVQRKWSQCFRAAAKLPLGVVRAKSSSSEIRQMIEFAGAVADLFRTHTQTVEHSQIQVRHRRALRVTNVATPAEVCAAHRQYRQVVVKVTIGIAQTTAINKRGVVEKITVAVFRGLQFAEEIAEHLDV